MWGFFFFGFVAQNWHTCRKEPKEIAARNPARKLKRAGRLVCG